MAGIVGIGMGGMFMQEYAILAMFYFFGSYLVSIKLNLGANRAI